MKLWVKLLLLAIILLLIGVAYTTGFTEQLTFESIKAQRDALSSAVQEWYLLSALLFVLTYIAVTGLSLPGAAVLTLLGGFLFGTLLGALFVNIGATLGATAAFLAARYVLGESLQKRYAKRLDRLNREIEKNGSSYLLTVRLIAIFPFWLVNLLAGLTRARLTTFMWTTSLGIIPGSLVYAYAGRQLGTLDSLAGILSWQVILAFALLGVLPLIPVAIKKLRS